MTKWKRPLLVMAAVGLVALGIGGGGTFASFNATASGNNIFSTGTLTVSTGNAGNALITAATTNLDPGDQVTGSIAVTDGGSLSGELFLTTSGSCVDSQAVTPNAVTYTGTPSLCGDLEIGLYQGSATYDASGTPTGSGATKCYSGSLSAGQCPMETLTSLASALANTASAPSGNNNTVTGIDVSSLASNGSVTIGATLFFPSHANADNGYQNAQAALPVTFDLEQNT